MPGLTLCADGEGGFDEVVGGFPRLLEAVREAPYERGRADTDALGDHEDVQGHAVILQPRRDAGVSYDTCGGIAR